MTSLKNTFNCWQKCVIPYTFDLMYIKHQATALNLQQKNLLKTTQPGNTACGCFSRVVRWLALLSRDEIMKKNNLTTNPVEARLAAELVSSGGAEVVIGTERFVQCGDEVEQSLPATLIAQRVLCFITALPQPERKRNREWDQEADKRSFFFF